MYGKAIQLNSFSVRVLPGLSPLEPTPVQPVGNMMFKM
jgi:hypothetical protein